MKSSIWSLSPPSARGAFDPLRSILWVLFDPGNRELDSVREVFQHEYNHLIGIVGRHLQVCLIDLYLSGSPELSAVVDGERALVESFVPAWLSSPNRLGLGLDVRRVAPEADMAILTEIMELCRALESCQWVIDGVTARMTREDIVRAVQHATLNVGRAEDLYSPGASLAALHGLSAFARDVNSRRVVIRRTMRGEYYDLSAEVTDRAPEPNVSREWRDQGIEGEILELLLVALIRKTVGLIPKRYTLHDRAELVLKWLAQILASRTPESLTEVLAGIASVFTPRVFLPYACFWRDSTGYKYELHALPFPFVPMSMPLMTRAEGNQVEQHFINPTTILGLREMPETIRRQSSCGLARSMADFCEFALGEVTAHDLRRRAEEVFRRLAGSLPRVLRSVLDGGCEACAQIRDRATLATVTVLVAEASAAIEKAAGAYGDWLVDHLAKEFRQVVGGVAGSGASGPVWTEAGHVYKYHHEDFARWLRQQRGTDMTSR